MSKIIMEADRPTGILHQVQTEDGKYYWVSTKEVDPPFGNGYETAVVLCRKDGSTSVKAWQNAKIWNHFKNAPEAVAWHKNACENLEVLL